IAATRIIRLTADVMGGSWEACISAGLDDSVATPIRKASLQNVLARGDGMENSLVESFDVSAEPRGELSEFALVTLAQLQSHLAESEFSFLVRQFCENLPAVLGDLRAAAAAGDVSGVEYYAHQIKGSVSIFGA